MCREIGPLKMFSWLTRDPLPVGHKAPDFTLRSDTGKKVRLSALRGKNVVLVFYPGDDTPICRRQLSEFRDACTDLRGQNTLVFGINPQSAKSHRAAPATGFHFPCWSTRDKRSQLS